MQVIITGRDSASGTRILNLSAWHFVLGSIALLFFVSLFGSLLTYWTLKSGIKEKWPIVYKVISVATAEEFASRDRYLRENLNAMAVKLGEVQAKLVTLEALGERVSGLAGVNPKEFNIKQTPGSGGVFVPGKDLNGEQLNSALDDLTSATANRSDMFSIIEQRLLEQRVQKMMVPTKQPVNAGYVGSGFGWRVDPFNHSSAMHTGLDFVAEPGTPILAAAGGVVMVSEPHPGYGNMIDIDHGGELVTRYAHASKVFVKAGDIVRPGQKIAEVGSSGRSTGPHLHFEVLVQGAAQDPAKFLAAGANRGDKISPAATVAARTEK
jgi:murein DD-endopeptidase MepM/ murein hydrolase activator NlpD